MNELTFDKAEVLTRIKANRDGHRAIFEEALEGYRKAVIAELERSLDDAKAGKKVRTYIELVEPSDHTDQYDLIIDMLELTGTNTVVLSLSEFKSYMRDEWPWREQFLVSNSGYSATAAGMVRP